MSDKSQRTEQPTQRRLQKAREDGRYASAGEFVSALQFMVFLALLGAGGAHWFEGFRLTARRLLAFQPSGEMTVELVTRLWLQICLHHLLPVIGGGLLVVVATLMFRLVTTRFGLSLKKLAPDLSRLNPLARLRELPSQNLPRLGQALILLPLFLWAVYTIARDKLDLFLSLPLATADAGARLVAGSLRELFWKAAGLFLVFGCIDWWRQARRFRSDLKMTKQEIRDEFKESEGNPQIKSRVRRLQRDQARRRMMREVPSATAVVVNPTHFAVAIRYEMDSMAAPLVVAKGKNYLALRIRQIAISHQVPIVENPPLAQALYKGANIGQEIPPHLYRAVAEILAYIFKLMNRRPGR
jgi:flagellar biosynthetic protein FlhB